MVLHFDAIFAATPNPMMVLDRDGRCLAVNVAWSKALGADEDAALVGRELGELFPTSDAPRDKRRTARLRRSLQRVVDDGEVDAVPLIGWRDAAGIERRWSITHSPVRGDDGVLLYVLQQVVDVSDVTRAEEEEVTAPGHPAPADRAGWLDRQRLRLLRLLDEAPAFLAVTRGPHHQLEMTNAAFQRLVGGRPMVGRRLVDALPETVDQGLVRILDQVYAEGRPFVGRRMTLHLEREPGVLAPVCVDFTWQPIVDDDGAVSGIIALGNDVTAWSRLEQQASFNERELAAIVEAIPQQVWTALPGSGDFDFVSRRLTDDLGAPATLLLGTGWIEYVHPEDRHQAIERWQHALRTGEIYQCELRLRHRTGTWRWYLARGAALRDDDDRIVKWFGTNTDIDEAVRANRELQQRNDFEQQLIGIVSHDLRNPLNAIGLSAAVIAADKAASERTRAATARVATAADRATRLIADLLDFTAARSTGTIPIHPEPTRLIDIVTGVVGDLTITHADRQIVVTHVGNDALVADPDRLMQVIDNLVGNALKHSPPETIVDISLRGEGETIVLDITNVGAIDDDDIARLFQPFQRGEGPATERSVGLGLYIAAQIVNAHRGSIEVQAIGSSTRFSVRLPRERAGA